VEVNVKSLKAKGLQFERNFENHNIGIDAPLSFVNMKKASGGSDNVAAKLSYAFALKIYNIMYEDFNNNGGVFNCLVFSVIILF